MNTVFAFLTLALFITGGCVAIIALTCIFCKIVLCVLCLLGIAYILKQLFFGKNKPSS